MVKTYRIPQSLPALSFTPAVSLWIEEEEEEDDYQEQEDDIEEEEVSSPLSIGGAKKEQKKRSSRRRSKQDVIRTRSGLPLHIQKALLSDIERLGGLQAVNLVSVCNQRPDIYGDPGTPRRRQVQNKVHLWRRLSELEYYKVLSAILKDDEEGTPILPHQTTPEQKQGTTNLKMVNSPYYSSPHSSSKNGVITPGSRMSTPASATRRAPPLALLPPSYAAGSDTQDDEEGFNDHDPPSVIDVNLDYPERNREFIIVVYKDVERDGVLHNGFDIIIQAELGDYFKDQYSAKLISENEILVTMPSTPCSYLHHMDRYFATMAQIGKLCPRSKLVHDVARNRILADPTSQTKQIMLRFPSGVHLINPQQASNEIECQVGPFSYEQIMPAGRKESIIVTYLSWKVDTHEENRRVVKTNRATTTTKGMADFAAHFSGSCFVREQQEQVEEQQPPVAAFFFRHNQQQEDHYHHHHQGQAFSHSPPWLGAVQEDEEEEQEQLQPAQQNFNRHNQQQQENHHNQGQAFFHSSPWLAAVQEDEEEQQEPLQRQNFNPPTSRHHAVSSASEQSQDLEEEQQQEILLDDEVEEERSTTEGGQIVGVLVVEDDDNNELIMYQPHIQQEEYGIVLAGPAGGDHDQQIDVVMGDEGAHLKRKCTPTMITSPAKRPVRLLPEDQVQDLGGSVLFQDDAEVWRESQEETIDFMPREEEEHVTTNFMTRAGAVTDAEDVDNDL